MVPLRFTRGRPKSGNKRLLVSVRYSPEVVAYFRWTGEGGQARMDGVLRQYVREHSGLPVNELKSELRSIQAPGSGARGLNGCEATPTMRRSS